MATTNNTAVQIVKDKCWIIERNGRKIASVLAAPDGVVMIKGDRREKFVSIKMLKDKYNLTFTKIKKQKQPMLGHEIYGYSCDSKPHNVLLDVTKKVPVYTKTAKSKSFYCAGYYVINFGNGFTIEYCPKLISINRYEFYGPLKTKTSAKNLLSELQ